MASSPSSYSAICAQVRLIRNRYGNGLEAQVEPSAVSTLPVVALGVDYDIYIYSRLKGILAEGKSLPEAYEETLTFTGNGVLFTGVTLTVGVGTWIFSPLKFQADMGILLTSMFLVNMLGAVLLLPALAHFLLPKQRPKKPKAAA